MKNEKSCILWILSLLLMSQEQIKAENVCVAKLIDNVDKILNCKSFLGIIFLLKVRTICKTG